jgi:solute:Na+ symporter, SSS family
MGVGADTTNTYLKDVPLFIAFVVLAIYTYLSGLRAPAAIAFVKDTIIYVFVIVAVFYIPAKIGGWGHIFGAAQTHFTSTNPATGKPFGTFLPTTKKVGSTQLDFVTLALGSALALFMYPHVITGTLAARRRGAIKRNMSLLPAYSVVLALIALFGYMAVADPATAASVKKTGNAQLSVPYLFQNHFPSWFTGVAFSGIIIGALVPAAIMSIGAANLFTRNIFKEFFKPDATPHLETRVSQWASLVVKLGALYFAVELPKTFSINLQLLGGVWILQTFPMLVGGLYTRWFHRFALIPGWLAGMAYGTLAAYNTSSPTSSHWASSSDIVFGFTLYIGISAFILNLAISVVLTLVLRAFKVPEGPDETQPRHFTAEAEDKPTEEAPAAVSAS